MNENHEPQNENSGMDPEEAPHLRDLVQEALSEPSMCTLTLEESNAVYADLFGERRRTADDLADTLAGLAAEDLVAAVVAGEDQTYIDERLGKVNDPDYLRRMVQSLISTAAFAMRDACGGPEGALEDLELLHGYGTEELGECLGDLGMSLEDAPIWPTS